MDSFSGKTFFRFWMLRKRLAETLRPKGVKALAVSVGISGLLFIVEGILLRWFIDHLIPAFWVGMPRYLVQHPTNERYLFLLSWLASACMIMIGIAGVLVAAALARNRKVGTYFTIAIAIVSFVTGIILLCSGIKYSGTSAVVFGSINIGLGILIPVLIGLCWYTLDPLGLHSEPTV